MLCAINDLLLWLTDSYVICFLCMQRRMWVFHTKKAFIGVFLSAQHRDYYGCGNCGVLNSFIAFSFPKYGWREKVQQYLWLHVDQVYWAVWFLLFGFQSLHILLILFFKCLMFCFVFSLRSVEFFLFFFVHYRYDVFMWVGADSK